MLFEMPVAGGCSPSVFCQQLLFNMPLLRTHTGLFLLPLLAFIMATALTIGLHFPDPS